MYKLETITVREKSHTDAVERLLKMLDVWIANNPTVEIVSISHTVTKNERIGSEGFLKYEASALIVHVTKAGE